MPQFDVNDSSGNRIGSITPTTDFADSLNALLDARAVLNSKRVLEVFNYANIINARLLEIAAEFDTFIERPSRIDCTRVKYYFLENCYPWIEANKELSNPKLKSNGKKLQKFLIARLVPVARELEVKFDEAQDQLLKLNYLDQLHNLTSQALFKTNNESVDRLEARNFFALDIKESTYLSILSKRDEAMDAVMNHYKTVNEAIEAISDEASPITEWFQRCFELEQKESEITTSVRQFEILVEAREEIALKLLDESLHVKSNSDISKSLSDLAELYKSGLISNDEFVKAKSRLIN